MRRTPDRIRAIVKVYGDELTVWTKGFPEGDLDERGHCEGAWCPSCRRYQVVHVFIVRQPKRGAYFTKCHGCHVIHILTETQAKSAFNESINFWEYVKAGGDETPQA